MKILAITGSSGGHIFPALGFLDTLNNKHKDIDILLVLPKKSITNQIESFQNKPNYISISSVRLSLDFKNFTAILLFFKGSLESMFILLTFRPDIVVGFGSLVCIPMVLFAWLFRMKTLIHEQNVIPGRANRFLAKFTDKIAISFAQTRDYFKDYRKKIVLTGNPIRKELNRIDKNKALDFFGFNSEKFTILVIGGSQGSHRINFGFLRTISAIADKSNFQVIHLTGSADYDFLKRSYRDLNINSRLFNFLEPMQYAYSACDLVVSRAGATTIAEIVFFGLAAIIIPYPFSYSHQIANAKVLETIGSGIIIQDNELDSDILRKNLENFINNPERIKAMRSNYSNISRLNANDLLAEAVLSLSEDISSGMK
ncbi:MAG: undecaprenyldiphospho-muramoylpentapeptide beta-N-acetylglucosaminyltransferase [Candidatus Omnitrophota bacterium]|nr:undecaprenyldiphospho-muramoylpentapeptide beta-N-acetylglucosaminyltransferase [Candidatus Omnitrophota bacterium]